jgi:hypothetical protein
VITTEKIWSNSASAMASLNLVCDDNRKDLQQWLLRTWFVNCDDNRKNLVKLGINDGFSEPGL